MKWDAQHNGTQCRVFLCLLSFMLSVADKPIMLSVIMLNAIMLIVIMQNVIILSVVEPTTHQFFVTYEWAEKGRVLHYTRLERPARDKTLQFILPNHKL